MNIKQILRAASCLAALVMLGSCGDTNPGPSVAVFRTATVSGSVTTGATPVNVFPSGAYSGSGALTSTAPVTEQTITVSLTSSPYPTSSTSTTPPTPQQISITGYSLAFVPRNGGPAITDPSGGRLGIILPAGGGTVVTPPIPLTSANTIALLQADPVLKLCTTHNYTYDVTITFFGTELGGTNASFTTGTTVEFTNGL